MTPEQVVELANLTTALWPNFEASDATLEGWLLMLADVDLEPARAAVVEIAAEGEKWAPPPGAVRRRALERAAGIPDADEAFAEAWRAAGRVGRLGTPEWSHPAIGEAIAGVGGWREFCLSESPEAMRAHFGRAYGAAAERAGRAVRTPPAAAAALAPPERPQLAGG